MTAVELESLRKVLEKVDKIPPVERPEVNFFDVGGAGYLENPTSDLMALFMGSELGVPRWLGKALLECLIGATPDPTFNAKDIYWQKVKAEREVSHYDNYDKGNKRLDIVYGDENFIVGIENKVYANVDNPLNVYNDLLKESGKSKKVYKCVLMPTRRGSDAYLDWPVVSYQELVDKARDLYGRDVASRPIGKWHFLYQELLAHLEQLATPGEDALMEKDTVDFVSEDYSILFKVSDLLEQFSDHVQARGETAIRKALGDNYSGEIRPGRNTWGYGKALRFSPKTWQGETQIVLVILNPKEGGDGTDVKFDIVAFIDREGCSRVDKIRDQFDFPASDNPLPMSLKKESAKWDDKKGQLLKLNFSPANPNLEGAICGLADLARWVNTVAYPGST